jgi:hypothetical protein
MKAKPRMNATTTIKLHVDTKDELEEFRNHVRESYDDLIRKSIEMAKNSKEKCELSPKEVEAINKARERIRQGHFVREAEIRKRLGL